MGPCQSGNCGLYIPDRYPGGLGRLGTPLRRIHGGRCHACVQLLFLPPVLRFIIADPQNWAVLFAFLFTAVIASQLSERARREALESNQRRRELERLYAFSQQLLATDNVFELLNSIPKYIVDAFSISDAAMFLNARQQRSTTCALKVSHYFRASS